RAVIGSCLPGHDVHHRRLAGAVGSDDATELAGVDPQGQPVERLEAVEAHGQILEIQNRPAHQLARLPADHRASLAPGTRPMSPRGRNSVTRTKIAPSAYSQTSGSAPVKNVFK